MNSLWLSGITFNKIFTSFLANGGGIGNGIFFMLTGYFMFGKEYKIRRIVKLLAQVYFYAIVILIAWVIIKFLNLNSFTELSQSSPLVFIMNAVIPITSGAWWFIQTYVILFLFIPVINNFLEKLDSKRILVLLLLIWIFWLVPAVFGFTYSFLQMAIFFYIFGAEIKKTNFTINKWLALLLTCTAWILLSFIDMKNSVILKNDSILQTLLKFFYNVISNAILTPLTVLLIFEFFKGLNIANNNFINTVASTTFGIYLIHDSNALRPLIWNKIFKCLEVQYNSQYFPLLAIASIVTIFCSCSIIDFLRQIIFEKKCLSLINKVIDLFTIKDIEKTE